MLTHTYQFNVAQDRRNTLGDDGCQSYTGYTHPGDKQQIQTHIQRCGDQQKTQGRNAVTQAPQDTGEHIVEEKANNAEKEDIQVFFTPIDNIRIGIEHLQHGPVNDGTEDHNHDGGDCREGNATANAFRKPFSVLGTEGLGDHDAGAGGDAHKQGQKQVQNGAGAANSRQSVVSNVNTDDHGIGGVV